MITTATSLSVFFQKGVWCGVVQIRIGEWWIGKRHVVSIENTGILAEAVRDNTRRERGMGSVYTLVGFLALEYCYKGDSYVEEHKKRRETYIPEKQKLCCARP